MTQKSRRLQAIVVPQIPQATTFLLDALKTFQSEGWTRLELRTLEQLAHCHRVTGEKEKLVNTYMYILHRGEVQENLICRSFVC